MTPDEPTEAYWNGQAASFDDEPDHGLTNDDVRLAWSTRFSEWLPEGSLTIADLGCGTGSVSLLLAEAGHEVVGIDLSPAMIEQARDKSRAAGASIRFEVGDVSAPTLDPGTFDVVFARHVIWALPEPTVAFRSWARLLNDGGRLIAVEGRWNNAGIGARDLEDLLAPLFRVVEHHPLSDDARLWGRPVIDERYAIVATSATIVGDTGTWRRTSRRGGSV